MKVAFCIAAAATALIVLAPPATATHVQCGDVITETTVLDSDLVCANANGSSVGLTIAADDVILWMNGHTMRSESGYGTGVGTDQARNNIQIRRGTFAGWSGAIDVSASDSTVLKVSVGETGYPIDPAGNPGVPQIRMVGDRNYLARNFVNGFPRRELPDDETPVGGISLVGDDAYTWGNTFHWSLGIGSSGDRPRHVLNTVDYCGPYGVWGMYVVGYTNGAVVNRNSVSLCLDGIHVEGAGDNVGGALIRLNRSDDNGQAGFVVNDAKAIVGRNTATGNSDIGIVSELAGTTIQNNTANNNYYTGIYAAPGTVDGGGNMASGNGDGTVPQCFNVQCGP